MTNNSYPNEKQMSDLQEQLDAVVKGCRASNKRKQHRHGKDYDSKLATVDSINLFASQHAPNAIAVLAGLAIQRLAAMPDFNPIHEAIAALDFDVDFDAIVAEMKAEATDDQPEPPVTE